MTWLLPLLGLALAALAPLAWAASRPTHPQGWRAAAVTLHRAQLAELDRDLAEGRVPAPEHALAVLEVQRRMLAADATADLPPAGTDRGPLVAALVLVPLVAAGLYLVHGSPGLPSPAARTDPASRQAGQMIEDLKRRLATLDPRSEQAREGFELLGNAEASLGRVDQAAWAWRAALAARFDPTTALKAAEATSEVAGMVTPEAAALFRRALDAAPADAPWRGMAERRLGEINRPLSPLPR